MNNLIEVNIQKKYRLPIIVLVNGILYFIIFVQKGIHAESILYCFMTTILIKISVLDEKTKQIPIKWNLLLMIIGILFTIMDKQHISSHLWGMMGMCTCLILLYIFSKGSAIGGGDIKLMGAAGLILGLEQSAYALLIACLLALVCHGVRMIKFGAEKVLAMGPYLSIGIWICAIWK